MTIVLGSIVLVVWVGILLALYGWAKDVDRREETGELPHAARRLRALADEDYAKIIDMRQRVAALREADNQIRRTR